MTLGFLVWTSGWLGVIFIKLENTKWVTDQREAKWEWKVWFNILKSTSIIYHINRIKNNTTPHMFTSTDAEEASDDNPTPLMIKIYNILGIEENFLNQIKLIYGTHS